MAATDLVRNSRDGDFFHYYWAARQALNLLTPGTDMVALTIEGASAKESGDGPGTVDEIIDVAEYFRNESLENGGLVVYRQLKHSTARPDEPWMLSGLKKTIEKFAAKYLELRKRDLPLHESATYVFVSNRVVDDGALKALEDVATSSEPRSKKAATLLARYLGILDPAEKIDFCKRFSVDSRAPSLLPLMHQYGATLNEFLPDPDPDTATRLKEAVARRATTLDSSPITRTVVLAELGTPEDQYYPAPPMFIPPTSLISRTCYTDIARDISLSTGPVIVHAPGGVGKSVFAQSMLKYLPKGSVLVAYDCYGLGSYRRATGYRHAHRQGIVQIANELATLSLCSPLLSGSRNDPASYSRAFMTRVRKASTSAGDNLVVIAIDAADNAVMASREIDGSRPFVLDLLREEYPANVRVVMFCRTERIGYLDAPAGVPEYLLPPLDHRESRTRLELKYGAVTELEALEFHRRTAGNPRVQEEVLDQANSVETCLVLLGEGFLSPDSAFDDLLQTKFDKILNEHGMDSPKIQAVSEVLATLRPRIPISVIAELTGTSPHFIQSFVNDLGRSLLVQGGAVQFRDEPTESWFRLRFRARGASAAAMADAIRLIASRDAYAAASLPELLWECDGLDEVVALALSSNALPTTNRIERREIEEYRVQFALKASLRKGNHFDAASLAFKAADLAAGRSRHIELIRANTDLAGEYLDPRTTEEIIASRSLRLGWPGSNLAYEGALLSFNSRTQEDARNRLRSAEEWLVGWAKATQRDSDRGTVRLEEIAEIAVGRLNTEGAAACLAFLSRLRSPTTKFRVGKLVAGRLIQRGEISTLNEFLNASKSNKYLQLAITCEAMRSYVHLDESAAKPVSSMLKRQKKKIDLTNGRDFEGDTLAAVCGALVMSLRGGEMSKEKASSILDLYLPAEPPHSLGQRSVAGDDPVLRAWALRGYVTGKELSVEQIASQAVLDEIDGKSYASTRDGREFRTNIIPLMPWLQAWARAACDPNAAAQTELSALTTALPKARHSTEHSSNLLLNMAYKIAAYLVRQNATPTTNELLKSWVTDVSLDVWTGSVYTAIRLLSAKPDWDDALFGIAKNVAENSIHDPEQPQYRVENLLDLSRAIRPLSTDEARHYFTAALGIVEKIGDEAYTRWQTTLAVANRASSDDPEDDRAFRLARLAEAFEWYMGDAFDIEPVIRTLGGLSPQSALAISSRWRDRRFGEFSQSVSALIAPESVALDLNPCAALALSVFTDRLGDVTALTKAAIAHQPERRNEFNQVAVELARLRGHFSERFDSPKSRNADGDPITRSRDWSTPSAEVQAEEAKVLEILAAFDYTTSAGVSAGCDVMHKSRHVGLGAFLLVVFAARQRDWARIVRAFDESGDLSLYEYLQFFKSMAELAGRPAAMKDALADLARGLAVRYSEDLAASRAGVVPWAEVEQASGVSRDELMRTAIRALGNQSEFLESNSSYHLLVNLTELLSTTQAQTLFDQIELGSRDLINDDAPDAIWNSTLEPPTNLAQSVSGFVWAALGDADEAIRWRAAHAVRILCQLGCAPELHQLNMLALAGSAEAFIDDRFVFYRDDALLWLLIALDRAAQDDLDPVAAFLPLFSALSSSDESHALMVLHLTSILGALSLSSAKAVADSSLAILSERTRIPVEPRVVEYSERTRHGRSKHEKSTATYAFDYDFRGDWVNPLATCFGLDPQEIEDRISSLIVSEWGGRFLGRHEEDVRWTTKVFRQGQTLSHYRDTPRIHDLDRYLTFHALMRVSNELACSLPPYRDPESLQDDFCLWRERFALTRQDGRWLSDRRDPTPLDQNLLDSSPFDKETWRWSVTADQFAGHLSNGSDSFSVWESSERSSSDRSENLRIRSALVDSEHSDALLAAMQTSPSRANFRVPYSGDDLEFERDGYVLRGWIDHSSRDLGLDRSDDFAGGISFPAPRPSAEFQEVLRLSPDQDERLWTDPAGGKPAALVTTLWSDQIRERDGRAQGNRGYRVTISRSALDLALESLGMDLIVTVDIDRATYDYSGRNTDPASYELGYLDDYFKIFIYRQHRGWFDARGPLSSG
jgi:hypothetical protein